MKGDANQLAYLRRLHGCLAAAVGSPEADAADMTESESSSLRGLPGPRRCFDRTLCSDEFCCVLSSSHCLVRLLFSGGRGEITQHGDLAFECRKRARNRKFQLLASEFHDNCKGQERIFA